MTLDVAALRADTPGCENVIHLNNAGSSLQPRPVAEAVRSYLDDEVRGGGYETADARRDEIDDFYAAVADLIGARPNEIAFLDSATLPGPPTSRFYWTPANRWANSRSTSRQ